MHPPNVDGKAAPIQTRSQAASRRPSPIGSCRGPNPMEEYDHGRRHGTGGSAQLQPLPGQDPHDASHQARKADTSTVQQRQSSRSTRQSRRQWWQALTRNPTTHTQTRASSSHPARRTQIPRHRRKHRHRSSWTSNGKHSTEPSKTQSRSTYPQTTMDHSQHVGSDPETLTGPRSGQHRGGDKAQQLGP